MINFEELAPNTMHAALTEAAKHIASYGPKQQFEEVDTNVMKQAIQNAANHISNSKLSKEATAAEAVSKDKQQTPEDNRKVLGKFTAKVLGTPEQDVLTK